VGDEARWVQLKQVWSEAVERKRQDELADARAVQSTIDEWSPSMRQAPVAWVKARIEAGDDAGPWVACWGDGWWFDALLDSDHDPRADLIDTVHLEHTEFTPAQIKRLARRAPQIVELKLEEIEDYDEHLASLFPGCAPWSRLRRLIVDSCEFNKALMPGLAATHLPALEQLRVVDHWDAYVLASASWLSTVQQLAVVRGSRNPDWLIPIGMRNLVELEFEAHPAELAEVVLALTDLARKPRLARLVLDRVPSDFVLPTVAGIEIVRG
jgi:hypothetical protein